MRLRVMWTSAFLLAVAGVARADDCPHAAIFDPATIGSLIDSGFTGLNHRKAIFGDTLPLAVSCAASTPPCGVCTVTGLLPEARGTQLRCAGDTSLACTIASEVADCGAPGTCRYFLSPPQPTAVGGVAACYTNEVTGPVAGTTDSDGGDLAVSVPYLGKLYLGASTMDACPRCLGDPVANDGIRGGTCTAGTRMGMGCDANGVSLPPYDDFNASSFDCPIASLIGTSSPGPLALSTQSQSRTITATSPPCTQTGSTALRCLCNTCNDAAGETCTSDADCPPSGGNPGICGGRRCIGGANDGTPCVASSECPGGSCTRKGAPTRPNECVGGVCTDTAPVGDDEGECTNGPVESYCVDHPNRNCSDDADCGGAPASCQLRNRYCFLDNGVIGGAVQFTGTATPPVDEVSDPTVLGTLFCQVPSAASSVNDIAGFPGVVRQRHAGRLTFAEDVVTRLVAPGGGATTIGAGPPNDVETSLTSPIGGALGIVSTLQPASLLGLSGLGHVIETTAPGATAMSPLSFTFEIAAAALPGGEGPADVDLFKDGVGPIPNCVSPTNAVPNDPCVAGRTLLGGGQIQVTVLSASGGEWTIGYEPGPPTCPPAPDVCLPPTVPGKSTLILTDRPSDANDRLSWKWTKGAATTKADFGDPLGSDAYALCLYDASGRRATFRIPAGGTCAGKPCWTDKSKGFAYKNRDAVPHGITKLALTAGAAGKAQLQAQGHGELLPMPPLLSLTAPLQVQLRNLTSGLCWDASFSAPFDKNTATQLRDKSD